LGNKREHSLDHDQELADSKSLAANSAHLDCMDRKILEVVLADPDKSIRDIGSIVGLSSTSVYKRMQKPIFKHQMQLLKQKFDDKLVRIQSAALDRLRMLIRSNDKRIALKACEIVLSPILQKGQVNVSMNQITFKTSIGDDGSLQQERIVIPVESIKENTVTIKEDANYETEELTDGDSR
jgi:hypothetical protein